MIRFSCALAAVAMMTLAVQAGEFNKKITIGQAAPSFSNLKCACSDKTVGLADFKADVVVICVTCNHCPVAQMYEKRMIEFAKKYNGKVDFIAVNCNDFKGDGFDDMKARAKSEGFNFPYLHDATQELGKALGASVTPEFFVLNKERKIVYTGAFDDNNDATKATKNYLMDAVEAALAGKTPATTETKPRGCGVKYSKK